MLEQHRGREIGHIRRGKQEIAHDAVEFFRADQRFDLPPHSVGPVAAHCQRHRRKQVGRELHPKCHRAALGRRVRNRIRPGAVFPAPLEPTKRLLSGKIQRYVVDLMPEVQTLQRFERADVPAFRRWMKKIGLDPQDLHTGWGTCSRPALSCAAGQKQIAPELQIQQPPDAIGSIFETRAMPIDQRTDLVHVEQGSQQSIRREDRLVKRLGARIQQPLAQRRGETHLLAIDDLVRQQILHRLLENVFPLPPRILRRSGTRAANSTSVWSRKGTRLSMEQAMLIWSCFMSNSTRYVF